MTRFRFATTALFALVLLVCFYFISSLYPEVLWFRSFGFESVWWFFFSLKWGTFVVAFALVFAWLYGHAALARRISNTAQGFTSTPFQFINQLIVQLGAGASASGPVSRLMTTVAIAFFSVVIALTVRSLSLDVFSFIHQVPFGLKDPVFLKDISYYTFTVPLLKSIQSVSFFLIMVTLILVGWIYFSQRRWNASVKRHVFALLAILFALVAIGDALKIYSVLNSKTGIVFGAGYTDISFYLKYYKALTVAYALAAVFFAISALRAGFLAPVVFVVVIVALSFISRLVIPGAIQSYVVSPNELNKETVFLRHNIALTRYAYGLDHIEEVPFPADYTLTSKDVQNSAVLLENIRLWDPEPLKQTFGQLQEIRPYYEFINIDVDRYFIDGKMQQVMLSPRELDISQLAQSERWVNRHLVYTHGYGVCMSPVSTVTPKGLPSFFVKDIPPASTFGLDISRPEIYFGEKSNHYIVVNTKQPEFDFPSGDQNEYTNYAGKGGVILDSFIKRLIYAMKFSDIKLLISTQLTEKSRILYDRQIKTIAQKIAPFLLYDKDPYLILTPEGRMVWMLDAYTVSSRFPYSEPYNGGVNYIRNAVKITVDAYDGEVHFYVVDSKDPIIATYQKIFPELFESFDAMPDQLKAHIRYPKDLFTVQAKMYSTYHMTDPQVFYNREDPWDLPLETYDNAERVMDPYYIVTQIPGDAHESFVMMLPFTPKNKNNMIAWLGARCDLDDYGKLTVFKFSKERTIYGPRQIESRIDQDTEISKNLTLWGQAGSRVIRGNLMVIPIKNSLIYVEPIYLQATQSQLPELKRVVLAYSDTVVMAKNLEEAVDIVFGGKTQISSDSDPLEESVPQKKQDTTGELLRKLSAQIKSIDRIVDELLKSKK